MVFKRYFDLSQCSTVDPFTSNLVLSFIRLIFLSVCNLLFCFTEPEAQHKTFETAALAGIKQPCRLVIIIFILHRKAHQIHTDPYCTLHITNLTHANNVIMIKLQWKSSTLIRKVDPSSV
jgi:hypothetical protein